MFFSAGATYFAISKTKVFLLGIFNASWMSQESSDEYVFISSTMQ